MIKKQVIAENIKHHRKKNSYTQESLAETISMTRATVSAWETGVNTPDIFTLVHLANLFKVSLYVLIGLKRIIILKKKKYRKRKNKALQSKLELLSDLEIEHIESTITFFEERKKQK